MKKAISACHKPFICYIKRSNLPGHPAQRHDRSTPPDDALHALPWRPATGARRALRKGSLGVTDLLRWQALPNGHAVVSDGQRLLDLGPVQALIDAAPALD